MLKHHPIKEASKINTAVALFAVAAAASEIVATAALVATCSSVTATDTTATYSTTRILAQWQFSLRPLSSCHGSRRAR